MTKPDIAKLRELETLAYLPPLHPACIPVKDSWYEREKATYQAYAQRLFHDAPALLDYIEKLEAETTKLRARLEVYKPELHDEAVTQLHEAQSRNDELETENARQQFDLTSITQIARQNANDGQRWWDELKKVEAESARLRKLVSELADDLEPELEARYKDTESYPDMQRRRRRDMAVIGRARAELGVQADQQTNTGKP